MSRLLGTNKIKGQHVTSDQRQSSRSSLRGFLQWGGGLLLLLIVVTAIFGEDDTSSTAATTETVTQTLTQTETVPAATVASKPLAITRADVSAAVHSRGLDYAIALARKIGAKDLSARYRRRAAGILERRARKALYAGRYTTAQRVAREARARYGSAASEAVEIRTAATDGLATKRAAIKVRREQARARKVEAERIRAEEEAAAAVKPTEVASEPDTSSDFAGLNCTEIGHSFNVEPGSDPVHDRDNDGVACESQ